MLDDCCRELTKKPHIAGNISDFYVAKLIHDSWTGYKFDKLEMKNYTVLLQYPGNYTKPNLLQLQDPTGTIIYDAPIQKERHCYHWKKIQMFLLLSMPIPAWAMLR